MRKALRSVISLCMASLLTFSLAACGSSQPGGSDTPSNGGNPTASPTESASPSAKEVKTLRLTMAASWYNKGWQAIESDIEAKAEQLGFKLDIDRVGDGDQGKQVLQARFATGDNPDLLGYNSLLAINNDFNVADKLMDMTGAAYAENYDADILASNFSIDGKLLGVPLGGSNIPAIFYNKKVFEDLGVSIPTNWNEFLAILDKAKAEGITPYFIAGKDTWTVQIFNIAGFQRDLKGKDVNEEIGKLYANTASILDYKLFADSFAKHKELLEKGYVQDTWLSDTYDLQQKAITEGTAAMTCNATWMMEEIQKKYPDQVDGIGAFSPVFDGDDPIGAWMPNAITGFSTSKNPEEVKAFLEYFGSLETQSLYFKEVPAMSIVKNIKVDGISPASQQILDEFQNSGRGQLLWQSAAPMGGEQVGMGDLPSFTMEALLSEKTPDEVLQGIRDYMEKDAKSKGLSGW